MGLFIDKSLDLGGLGLLWFGGKGVDFGDEWGIVIMLEHLLILIENRMFRVLNVIVRDWSEESGQKAQMVIGLLRL